MIKYIFNDKNDMKDFIGKECIDTFLFKSGTIIDLIYEVLYNDSPFAGKKTIYKITHFRIKYATESGLDTRYRDSLFVSLKLDVAEFNNICS